MSDSVLPAQDEALPGADSTRPRGASSGVAKWMDGCGSICSGGEVFFSWRDRHYPLLRNRILPPSVPLQRESS